MSKSPGAPGGQPVCRAACAEAAAADRPCGTLPYRTHGPSWWACPDSVGPGDPVCWSLSPFPPRRGSRRRGREGVSGTGRTWFLGCAALSVAPDLQESLGLVPILRLRVGLVPVVFVCFGDSFSDRVSVLWLYFYFGLFAYCFLYFILFRLNCSVGHFKSVFSVT